MKKYILTSIMSLFLIVGTGLVLTATEKKECCSSSKTAEAVKTSSACAGSAVVQTASACGDKETKAESTSSEAQMIQTSSVDGAAKSGCTSAAAAAGCSGSAATKTVEIKAGECTKAPAGVSGQRASREL